MFKAVIIMTGLIWLSSCNSENLPTIKELSVEKYAGTWYEIARLPNKFEKNLECVTATYTPTKNGKIEVLNKGYVNADSSRIKSIKGIAWIPNNNDPGKLKVQFFWPFSGKYWIIELDSNYNHALVGDPSRKYLWILSRSPEIDTQVYEKLITAAKKYGFETEKIILTNQRFVH